MDAQEDTISVLLFPFCQPVQAELLQREAGSKRASLDLDEGAAHRIVVDDGEGGLRRYLRRGLLRIGRSRGGEHAAEAENQSVDAHGAVLQKGLWCSKGAGSAISLYDTRLQSIFTLICQ